MDTLKCVIHTYANSIMQWVNCTVCNRERQEACIGTHGYA